MLRRRCSRLHHGPRASMRASRRVGVRECRWSDRGIRGRSPDDRHVNSHCIVCLTIVCDTQYSVSMSETEALETHLQELRRGTVVLACLRLLEQPGLRLRTARGARARAGSTPTPTRSTPCCAASRSRDTSRASGTPTRRGLASSTAPARRAPAWPPPSPTTSARSPRRSTHCPRRTDMNTSPPPSPTATSTPRCAPCPRSSATTSPPSCAPRSTTRSTRASSSGEPHERRRARRAHRARRPRQARRRLHRPAAVPDRPRYYLDWWRLLKLLLWIVPAVRRVRRRARPDPRRRRRSARSSARSSSCVIARDRAPRASG